MADTSVPNVTPTSHIPKTMIGTQDILDNHSPWLPKGRKNTLGSFISQTYEKKRRGLTDTVTLFSNIDDPKAVPFLDYYADNDTDNRPGVAASVPATEGDTYGVLNIQNDEVGTYGSLFKSDRFPRANKKSITYGQGTGDNVDSDRTLQGSFNGVDGTFECSGSCTAEANDKGVLISLTGEWKFKPKGDVKTLTVPDAEYDSNYLSFGYWISETTTASGSRFEVGTLYDGSQPITNTIAGMTGTATYIGEAAGAYARKGDNPAVGEFTGHASLTADFGDGTKLGTIKGTISQLVDGDQVIDQSWTVELQKANIEFANSLVTFDGQTPRGGNWRGGFFGTTGTDANDYPRGVAGDFTGHFENGHVIGAFGATRR